MDHAATLSRHPSVPLARRHCFRHALAFRSVAVIEIDRIQQPSIRFWSDEFSVAQGSCTRLHWEVRHVREAYLDGEDVVGRGEREVCPAATRAYELEVVLAGGATTLQTIEIEVVSP